MENKPFQPSNSDILKSKYTDDTISLTQIIFKLNKWKHLVWPKKYIILGLSLFIGLSSFALTKLSAKKTYSASYELFFEKDGGGLSSAMRLASTFGLSLGGSMTSSSIPVQKFLTSRDNISNALINGNEGERLIDRFFTDRFESDNEFANIFLTQFESNRRFKDSILTSITFALNENNLFTSINEETGVMSFVVNGRDESFVFDFSKALISNTEIVFEDLKRIKNQYVVNSFQEKVDSIESAIDATLLKIGEYEDQNSSLVSSVDKMKSIRLTIALEALKVAYGEYIKGLEMSKAELINLKAPFQYFDVPTYPLIATQVSAMWIGFFSSIITVFALLFFFIGQFEAKNLLRE